MLIDLGVRQLGIYILALSLSSGNLEHVTWASDSSEKHEKIIAPE